MSMKKLVPILLIVCILGLITIYQFIPRSDIQDLRGVVLNNNTPASGFSMTIIYDDHTVTAIPDHNGHYTLPADVGYARELQILNNGTVVVSYGPPFSKDRDYSANINVRDRV